MRVATCGLGLRGQVSHTRRREPKLMRIDLKFRLVLKMSIVGLVSKPSVTTQISDVTCPFELPVNSV